MPERLPVDTSVGATTMPSPVEDISGAAARGILWMAAQKWAVRISGFATIAILARLLEPEHFGIVAAAATVIPFIQLLSDLGFSTYVVQASKIDQRMLSTGFWFSVFAGAVLSGSLAVGAPLAAALFRMPDLVPVLRVMALSIAVAAISSIPMALLRRRMAFRALALQGTAAAMVAQVVALGMAFAGAQVWALVAQIVAGQLVLCCLAWRAVRWRPSRYFAWDTFLEMARFGSKVIAVDFVGVLRLWAETAIVAATLGAAGLGYLNIAQRLVQVAQDLSAAAFVPVSTAAFARVRESAPRLRRAYLRALSTSYAVVLPIMVFVAVGSGVLVPSLFGTGWGPSVPVVTALAVAGIFTMGAMLDHGFFYGTGQPGRWLGYAIGIDALTVGVTAVAVHRGLHAVALGFVGVAIAATVSRWFLVSRHVGAPVRALARPFAPIAVSVLLSGGMGLAVMLLLESMHGFVQLAAAGTAIALTHVAVVRLLMGDTFHEGIALLRRLRGEGQPAAVGL